MSKPLPSTGYPPTTNAHLYSNHQEIKNTPHVTDSSTEGTEYVNSFEQVSNSAAHGHSSYMNPPTPPYHATSDSAAVSYENPFDDPQNTMQVQQSHQMEHQQMYSNHPPQQTQGTSMTYENIPQMQQYQNYSHQSNVTQDQVYAYGSNYPQQGNTNIPAENNTNISTLPDSNMNSYQQNQMENNNSMWQPSMEQERAPVPVMQQSAVDDDPFGSISPQEPLPPQITIPEEPLQPQISIPQEPPELKVAIPNEPPPESQISKPEELSQPEITQPDDMLLPIVEDVMSDMETEGEENSAPGLPWMTASEKASFANYQDNMAADNALPTETKPEQETMKSSVMLSREQSYDDPFASVDIPPENNPMNAAAVENTTETSDDLLNMNETSDSIPTATMTPWMTDSEKISCANFKENQDADHETNEVITMTRSEKESFANFLENDQDEQASLKQEDNIPVNDIDRVSNSSLENGQSLINESEVFHSTRQFSPSQSLVEELSDKNILSQVQEEKEEGLEELPLKAEERVDENVIINDDAEKELDLEKQAAGNFILEPPSTITEESPIAQRDDVDDASEPTFDDDRDAYIKSLNVSAAAAPTINVSTAAAPTMEADISEQQEQTKPLNSDDYIGMEFVTGNTDDGETSRFFEEGSESNRMNYNNSTGKESGIKLKYLVFCCCFLVVLLVLLGWAGFYYLYYEKNYNIDFEESTTTLEETTSETWMNFSDTTMQPSLEPSNFWLNETYSPSNAAYSSNNESLSMDSSSPSTGVKNLSPSPSTVVDISSSPSLLEVNETFFWTPLQSFVKKAGISVSISSDGQVFSYGGKNVHVFMNNELDYTINANLKAGIDTVINLSGDGKSIAIGSSLSDDSTGRVQIYHFQGNDWVLLGSPLVGSSVDDGFGSSLQLSYNGTRVIVGSPSSSLYQIKGGYARVFQYFQQNNSWVPIGDDIKGLSEDNTGCSVSITQDGTTIAVGSKNSKEIGPGRGKVDIYVLQFDTWTNYGQSLIGEVDYGHFGTSVSLNSNGTIIAVSADSNDQHLNVGVCRVFSWDYSSNLWVPFGSDFVSLSSNQDLIHEALSLSGDGNRVAFAAQFYQDNVVVGNVHVLEYKHNDWILLGSTISGDGSFGKAIQLNNDGTMLGLGAPGNGAFVYVYEEDDLADSMYI